MPTKNKFLKRYITWVVCPNGAYLGCIMSDTKADAPKRFQHPKEDHFWDGVEFIHVPIEIQVPKEIENKLIEGDAHA